jgi:hypothetical protein
MRRVVIRRSIKATAILIFSALAILFASAYTGAIPNLWGNVVKTADRVVTTPAPTSTTVKTIPVLLYHGIMSPADRAENSVKLSAFRAQMAYLASKGYRTISPAQYTAWTQGKHPVLPLHPILITFDCGQTSALLAQPVLRQYGFRPVMYVVSGFADHSYGDYYLSWDGLNTLQEDGWYMQFHAGPCGHGYISVDTPYNCDYDWTFTFTEGAKIGHRYYSQVFGQPGTEHQARVEKDVNIGMAETHAHLLVSRSALHDTFAVPWSDYGQPQTSNIPWLARYFATQWAVVFIQDNFPAPAEASRLHLRFRIEIDDPTTMGQFAPELNSPLFLLTAG